jgi:hypothetical protein
LNYNQPQGTFEKELAAMSDDINSDVSDLRSRVIQDDFETEFGVREVGANEVSEGRIFGLTAGERMILSIILFLAVTVLGVALLFATGTIVIH